MNTTWKARGETKDGEHVSNIPAGERGPVWDLDAIGRRYEAAKADISDPWPETEAIDVRAITPPAASRGPSTEQASASCLDETEVAGGRLVPDPPAVPGRPLRAWRRWLSRRTGPTPEAR
jgi:hypothetical protein